MVVLIIRHTSLEGPGTLAVLLGEKGIRFETVDAKEFLLEPPQLKRYDAVFITGGPMSVNDEAKHPFLVPENKFILQILDEKKPVLGICLGAQLIAKALKAKVGKNSVAEVGNTKVTLTPEGKADPVFNGFRDSFDVFQWHEDAFELPMGALNLATSDACTNQCLRFGSNAYGILFHLEVTPEMVEAWCSESAEWLKGKASRNEIVAMAHEKETETRDSARKFFGNFFKIANL